MLWAFAYLWWFAENRYFGWNARPSNGEALICDGIVFILIAIA